MNQNDVLNMVAACRLGNKTAMQQLYECFAARVYRIAARMVGIRDADDVTQEIFLRVFQRLHQFRGDSKFETWLFRVAVNACLMWRRSHREPVAGAVPDSIAAAANPQTQVDERELFHAALDQLSPELRAVFVLRELEHLSYQEIADTLNTSPGTIASRLNRARKELREYLVSQGWEC